MDQDNKVLNILNEDNPGDVELVREALDESKLHINLHVASDGEIAMKFLRAEDNYANAPCPDVIFLGFESSEEKR